jgi:ATP-grasp domain
VTRIVLDLLLGVSELVEAHPEIVELDCNPVKVLPDGVVVVDARVRVEAASPPPPLGRPPPLIGNGPMEPGH